MKTCITYPSPRPAPLNSIAIYAWCVFVYPQVFCVGSDFHLFTCLVTSANLCTIVQTPCHYHTQQALQGFSRVAPYLDTLPAPSTAQVLERPTTKYLSVRPLQCTLGSSYSVDASVQVYDNVDSRDEDLGCDEDDDWISILAPYTASKAEIQKPKRKLGGYLAYQSIPDTPHASFPLDPSTQQANLQ